jgi:hypothetical protein
MTNTISWDALGAIGELIGAVAVVATLLYLAAQIRQNNASQRIATKLEMTRQFADFIDMLVLQPDICAIHDRGLAGEALSDAEMSVFTRLMAKAAWQFSTMHLQYVVQNMHAGDWEESRSLIAYYCSTPGFQKFWQTRNRAHGPEFLQYIDDEIQRANAGRTPITATEAT